MKRRVKLGQSYQGVKITRLDGLTIVETDGETQGAKVVLNSKELAFYGADGQEQLYFDPVEGIFKFCGALNVNNNFIVDKLGNVKVNGGINLKGPITWGDNIPNKKRYAASTSGPWHDTMQSGDIYCCDWNYTTGAWGDAYKFVGTDGRPGSDGSDADVPEYIKSTHIDATGIQTFHIKANKVEAVCPSGSQTDTETGFILTGAFEDRSLRYLRIYSYPGLPPTTVFTSPQGCSAVLRFGEIKLDTGMLSFRDVGHIDWGENAPHAVFA